ncbi:Cell wall integrity transcriptional regulator CAS5 [Vanrija pseudolonga]|uniref:Cell wall integrity transcriptional regulator CAS5 n=1 Tax=Vanrija pseudolonga TaxID=143232 RepID=A0AAF1BGE1_9TREE|nr:Cell wall integrity transcriptional regulator CAS5 [Vanrija pseudolonga]
MGGDHKCPLCSATFTRPQHVGRHLRAHTGDRPYECKECPLRFARSDLLSRHVNKAHPKPNGVSDNSKNDKKARRRSSVSTTASNSSSASVPPAPPPVATRINGAPAATLLPISATHAPVAPDPTLFQAQRMYPNHPLLQTNNVPVWSSGHLDLGGSTGLNLADSYGLPLDLGALSSQAFSQSYGSAPMRLSGSDQGIVPSAYASTGATGGLASRGFELSMKKRACDQCNHSKVRCDFAEPCARCSTRSIQCTYTKPQRSRTLGYPSTINTASSTASQSPSSSIFSSPASTTSPTLGRSDSPTNMFDLRRNSIPMAMSAQSFLTSDALFAANLSRAANRPPVPDTDWDGITRARGQGITASNLAASQNPYLTSPSNTAGPGLAATPALTNSTSPAASDFTDITSSASASVPTQWALPHSSESAWAFHPGIPSRSSSSEHPSLSSSLQTNGMWAVDTSGDNSSTLGSALSEDEDTPTSDGAKEDIHDHDRRRRSSASVWASAFNDMSIEDRANFTFDQSVDMNVGFQPQRHMSLPEGNDGQFAQYGLPTVDLNLWKLFLEPVALATPEQRAHDLDPITNQDTPRGISKSNSMPDLTTPTTATASLSSFPVHHGPGGTTNTANMKTPTVHGTHVPSEASMSKWKAQIQERHAAFNMRLDPGKTEKLPNPTFATGAQRQMRPQLHPLMGSTALQQTLAPERTLSFGPPAFDPFGVLMTPGVVLVKTPTKLLSQESRPGNKRQASQTLVPDAAGKRSVFTVWRDDDGATEEKSSLSAGSSAQQPPVIQPASTKQAA